MKKDRNGNRMWTAMVALVLGTSGLMACESAEQANLDQAGTAEDSVTIALSTVPASTLCIRVTATPGSGSATVKSFIVTPGATSASLQMGTLLPGSYSFTADAFNVACTSISGAGNWVADPVAVTVRAGVATTVTMNFRKNNPVVVNANFLNNVKSVVAGYSSSIIVTDSGLLVSGYIASSTTFTRASYPEFDSSSVPGNAVVTVASTTDGACALRADGTIWCWGYNRYGELGPGAPLVSFTTPVQVTGLTQASQVVAGHDHACAYAMLSGIPGVYCWGNNQYGQLGNNTTTASSSPVYATYFTAVYLAAGAHSTFLIDQFGNVRGWGRNDYGQIGDGSTINRLSPVDVWTPKPFLSVSAGELHTCGLSANGQAFCWGGNYVGQVGDGTTTTRLTPTLVAGLLAKQVVSGLYHSCALTVDGETVCWGNNSLGSLGNRDSEVSTTISPVYLNGVSLTYLSNQSSYSTCGISTSLDVYCWGFNQSGNLGNGTNTIAYSPVRAQLQ